ncbi:hypothetical protein [Amycolatopsis sp. NPDC003676]
MLSLANSFRDALAAADDAALRTAAAAFVEQNEEDAEVEDVIAFLKELATLAAGAAAQGHHLYCTISL